jgi:hypothetical protein
VSQEKYSEHPRPVQQQRTEADSAAAAATASKQNADAQSNRGQQNYVRGRVNHVAAETAQEAQDVVFGMFLVNSAPALVLFDSGASHTFISADYVAKYSIPLCTMPSSMLVNSPGGNMRAVYRCLGVKIQIMGKEFCANPIVLPSGGIDIILGMEWLTKYDAVIHCSKRSVVLTS